jgi:type III secretory pathway component EscV
MSELPRLLHVAVTLAPALHKRVRAIPLDARRQVEEALAALLGDLGLHAEPVVLLRYGTAADPIISVRVAGIPCSFPAEMVSEALGYVTGTAQLPSLASLPMLLAELTPEQGAELTAVVCRAAVSAQPELLASADMTEAAKAALRLGISLSELETVPAGAAADAERLIATLASGAITVHVEPALLRDLTSADGAAEKFRYLRDGMFAELGLPLPPIRLRPDPSLRPGAFAARFNAVRLLPSVALPVGTILVNHTADFLTELGFKALPTLNPSSRQPAAIADATYEKSLDEQGHTTWDRVGHVILSLAQDIREHAYQVMTSDVAAEMTRRLGMGYPVLERDITRHVPPGSLAPVLRELLASQVSIRNLRRIAETLLRLETSPAADMATDPVTAVRSGLADAIAARASHQTRTAVVYLLDKQATGAVAAMDSEESLERASLAASRISAGIRAELAQLPPASMVPAVLTSDETRAPLARTLRPEFPWLTVLGMGDLPPDWNVQPVTRVSLG